MPRIASRVLLFALLLTQPGCFYGHFRIPLDVNVDDTHIGDKEGRASAQAIMWLVSWGDCGVRAAAQDGQLAVVQHLDTEYLIFLFGAYTRRTTIAYGE